MEEESGFDSVSWDRNEQSHSSPSGPTSISENSIPVRSAPNRRTSSTSNEPQAGDEADGVDLAGIGKDGLIECVVDAPIKENDGTKDAYVSYRVTTQSFMKPEFSIRRRFQDFVYLRHALYKDYQAAAVPPLPEKNNMAYVRGDRFSTEFTQRRAWSLHRFLKRITLHPILRRAPIFLLFLESADWNQHMRSRPSRSNTTSENVSQQPPQGFFDNVADTMLNAFSKVHKPDKRFIEVMDRLNKLDEDLNHVEKIVARVVRREGDLEQDYLDLATNMRKLTPLEPAIEAPVQMFSGCVEETSRGWKGLKDHTDQNYLGSLKDMDAYISSVKALLKTREQKQLDFEGLTDYLQKASQERDTLASASQYGGHGGSSLNPATFIRNKVEDMRGVDHETSRRDRARKLEIRIEELNREVDIAKSTSEMFDQQVMKEVDDFERIKSSEFRDSLGALAEKNIEYYQSVIDTWERFLMDQDEGNKVLKGKTKSSTAASAAAGGDNNSAATATK